MADKEVIKKRVTKAKTMRRTRVEQLEDERIELVRQGLSGQLQALEENISLRFTELSKIMKETRDQAIKTNGRVTSLEKESLVNQEKWNQLLKELHESKKETKQEVTQIKELHSNCGFSTGNFIQQYEKDIKPSKTINFLFSSKRMTAITILGVSLALNMLSKVDVVSIIKQYWTKLIGL